MTPQKPTTAKKARWSAAKKAEVRRAARPAPRSGALRDRRPSGDGQWRAAGERAERRPYGERDERASYQGREDRRPYGKPAFGERSERPPYRGRDERPTYQNRDSQQNREERPAYRDRDERRPYGKRPYGERTERPAYQNRDERPAYQGRDERPAYQGREERPSYRDRDERRPYGRRPYGERTERPAYQNRDERPAYQGREERPSYRDRVERPAYQGRGERPAYQGRDERPAYQGRDERPAYQGRDERPAYRERPRPDRRDKGGAPAPHRGDLHVQKVRRQEKPTRELPDRGPVQDAPVAADNAFAALGLPDVLVRRLARDGITAPFPIQAATIPDALAGRDVLGRGRTGSGKTLAFGLPTLARLAAGEPAAPKRPRALILVPTRELAIQVSDALEPLAHVAGVRHKLVAGGLAYATQFAALERGVDLLIATPGRLVDLIEREAVSLAEVGVAILDEADHMADMGFLPDVTALLDMIPEGGQRLLFSATLDKGIDELVARYLTDPVEHATDAATASVTTMAHHVLLVDPAHKKLVTAQVANRVGRTIVFVRTKLGADRVAREIREQGVLAAALHGGLNQGARNRVLAAFRDGDMPVLVATDVAARGIHVDEVSVVLQVDPPGDPKDYLHRAGRTARAGETGTVVTLALPHQRRTLERLCAAAGVEVTPVKVAPGDDALLATTGARRTSGVPVPEEAYLRIVEGPPRRRGPRPQGGPRRPGPRSAGRGRMRTPERG